MLVQTNGLSYLLLFTKKLKDSDCINKLLVQYYDILHSQGTAFVVGDIEDYLAARGVSV